MTAQEYLEQGRWIDQQRNLAAYEIAQAQKMLRVLSAMHAATVATVAAITAKTGLAANQIQSPVNSGQTKQKIVDWECEEKRKLEALIKLKKQIQEVINAMPDETERAVLNCRYMQRMKWAQISRELHLPVGIVRRRYASALRHVQIPKHPIFFEN